MTWGPIGGTGDGPRATISQIKRAEKAIGEMKKATSLDGIHKGQTVVIMGNAEHMCDMDLSCLERFPIISCNRVLRPWKRGKQITPTYIMMGDREPYCQERDEGRLEFFAKHQGHFIGSDSLFDPNVRLRGPHTNPNRRAQPPPKFPVYIYKIGTAGTRQPLFDKGVKFFPMELKTFKNRLESCQNVSGSMIQCAAIMGAKRILSIGIDLKWPSLPKPQKGEKAEDEATNHTYIGRHGQHSQRKSLPYTQACMRWAKEQFKKSGIGFLNLSPTKDTPYSQIWGNCPIGRVRKEAKW